MKNCWRDVWGEGRGIFIHQSTEFPDQIREHLMAIFKLINNSELNPLKCNLDVRLLNSEYAGKRLQADFLVALARYKISVFPNLRPKYVIS